VAVVLVSSELDEIYALADRIAVMYEGKITGFRPPDVPVEELGLLMAGGAGAQAAEAPPSSAAPAASAAPPPPAAPEPPTPAEGDDPTVTVRKPT
jgi:simple sugar transport system ATP-binding protein